MISARDASPSAPASASLQPLVECKFVVLDGHHHMAAMGEQTEQQFASQRFLDLLLDYASHRPGPHLRIETMQRQPAARFHVDLDGDLLFFQLRLELGK